MTNFLTAEFSKLLKKKNFYISLAAIVLASIFNVLIFMIYHPDYATIENVELQHLMLRFIANKFVSIIIIFVTTVFIADTAGNTVKNAITIGYSRYQIYVSKIILGVVVIFIMITSAMVSTFVFTGIWMTEIFTINVFWEALIRFSMVLIVYCSLFILSLSICYVLSNNMLFTVSYFVIFLVLTEIIETIVPANIASMTLTYQLRALNNITPGIWPYVVGSAPIYIALSMSIGIIIINRIDIK